MSVAFKVIAFQGWPNALSMGNGTAELVVTLDVGPRILSYTRKGGLDPFNIYKDQAGGVAEQQWRNRGGHRLWLAPEGPAFSYHPDNRTVAWEKIGENGARLTPPPETTTGFQKQIDLVMEAEGAGVTVTRRITRTAAEPCRAAPWALTSWRPAASPSCPCRPWASTPGTSCRIGGSCSGPTRTCPTPVTGSEGVSSRCARIPPARRQRSAWPRLRAGGPISLNARFSSSGFRW